MIAVKDFTNVSDIAQAQAVLVNEKELTTNVSECASCGAYHADLTFAKLKQPVDDGAGNMSTHVSECPATGLQLKLAFQTPALVAARERASQVAQVGQQLHIDGMDENEIQKVLQALREV